MEVEHDSALSEQSDGFVPVKSESTLFSSLFKMPRKMSLNFLTIDLENNSFRALRKMKFENLSKNFVVSHLNPLLIKWDMLIVVLAMYSCIIIPVNLSFLPDVGELARLDLVVDFCFVIDIIVNFRTSAINS